SRRRHTRWPRDWSSDVCSSDLYVKFIPYKTDSKNVLTAQVTIHDDIMITAIDKESKSGDPTLLVWDISDPENPKRVGQWTGAPRSEERRVGKERRAGMWGEEES